MRRARRRLYVSAMHSVDPTTESMIRSVLAYAENRLRLDPVPLDRGSTDPAALEFADDLGVAMQLANILRDVREDVDMGRIYLPQDELRAFGVSEQALLAGEPVAGWEPLIRYELDRAHQLFKSGLRVTAVIPRRAAACVLTMAGIYQAIVADIERDPYLPLRQRASLSSREKLSVMLRSWLQAV